MTCKKVPSLEAAGADTRSRCGVSFFGGPRRRRVIKQGPLAPMARLLRRAGLRPKNHQNLPCIRPMLSRMRGRDGLCLLG